MNSVLAAPVFPQRTLTAGGRWRGVARNTGESLRTSTLIQVLAIVVPSMMLLGLGQMTFAAYALFGVLVPLLGYHLVERRGMEALSVVVAVIPLIMLLRGLVLYNSLQLLLAVCLWAALDGPGERARFVGNRPLTWFLGTCLVYWLASFVMTGDYSSNSRMVELGLAAASVFVLCGHRSRMAASAVGIAISGLAMSVAMMPYGARLGIASGVFEVTIGNPITLGLSASLAYLLSVADRGKWMSLRKRPIARAALGVLAGAALILSTSRGSWLVTSVGVLVILLLSRSGRSSLIVPLLLLGAATVVILQTERGAAVSHYFDNAVGDDRSLDKRTTGRANQWEALPRILDESPLWGFGPGSSRAVSERFTKDGKPWHSLYLLVGAETGLPGLAALFLLLGVLAVRGIHHLRICGEIVPFMALVCFVFIGVSVSGIDAISGVFLGYAFGGGDVTGFRRVLVGIHAGSAGSPAGAAKEEQAGA